MPASPSSVPRASRLLRSGVLASVGLCLLSMGAGGAPDEKGADAKGWIHLFNGKDLTGWTPKIKGYEAGENYADTFRAEGGVLKVSYDKYPKFDGKFGHLFYEHPYSHYRMRLEYRFVGDQCPGGPGWALRNSGIMIHCQSPQSMRKDQDFPVSVEVQFLGGGATGERPTCNVCSPGTDVVLNGVVAEKHCMNSKSKTYRGDQWVPVEIEVLGDGTIKHFIDGELVLEYEKPQLDPRDADARALIKDGDRSLKGGYIALQAESHPVEFRNVELLPLDR